MKYLEDYAVKNNIYVSKCKVRKSEQNNISLYSKLGYKIVKEEIIINKNGDEIPALTMQKNLTPDKWLFYVPEFFQSVYNQWFSYKTTRKE